MQCTALLSEGLRINLLAPESAESFNTGVKLHIMIKYAASQARNAFEIDTWH